MKISISTRRSSGSKRPIFTLASSPVRFPPRICPSSSLPSVLSRSIRNSGGCMGWSTLEIILLSFRGPEPPDIGTPHGVLRIGHGNQQIENHDDDAAPHHELYQGIGLHRFSPPLLRV